MCSGASHLCFTLLPVSVMISWFVSLNKERDRQVTQLCFPYVTGQNFSRCLIQEKHMHNMHYLD